MQASVLAIHKIFKVLALRGKPYLIINPIKTPYYAV